MKKSIIAILFLLIGFSLFASNISIASPNGQYTLSGDTEKEDYTIAFDDDRWSLVATRSSIDGIRLRGSNRAKSQSIFSLTVIEKESGRIITLNSNVADGIEYIQEDNTLSLLYRFDEGIMVPLVFSIDNSGLRINIDTGKIEENEEVFITELQLLPFFSDSSVMDDGYFMIPDGEGALLSFNNGISGIYRQPLYSRDYIDSYEIMTTERENVRLPVFGVERNDLDIIVVATKGEGIATLNASSSSVSNPYNQCYFSYSLRRSEEQSIASDAFQTVYESPRIFNSEIEVEIIPVTKEKPQSGYVAMAKALSQMFVQDNKKDFSLILNINAISESDVEIFGIKTPFKTSNKELGKDDFIEVLSSINELGIPLLVNFDSWNKDQVLGRNNFNLKLDQSFMSKKEQNRFIDNANEDGIIISASYDPIRIKGRISENIRNISGEMVREYTYNVNSSYQDTNSLYYLKNIAFCELDWFSNEYFVPSYKGIGEISYSDYSAKHPLDKDSYGKTIKDKLEALDYEYAIYGGNWYSLGNCFHVFDAPYQNSGFKMLDKAIPFYEIALSGAISYSFDSINSVADPTLMLLKILETGAVPVFTIDGNSDIDYILSFIEKNWNLLSSCIGQRIVNHIILPDGRRYVSFANGFSVDIDYMSKSYEIGGIYEEIISYR